MAYALPDLAVTGQVIAAAWGNQNRDNWAESALAKFTTAGDLFVGTGAGAGKRLGKGTANQVLKTNAAATDLEWGNSGSGSLVRAYNSSSIAVVSGSWVTYTMDSESFDTDTMHDTSSNTQRITFTTAGTYRVHAHLVITANATEAEFGAKLLLNAGATEIARTWIRSGPATAYFDLICERAFSAGDYVVVQVWQATGSSSNLNGTAELSYVSAERIG